MFFSAYSVGYDSGRSDERRGNHNREVVHQILTGERPVKVDQSYIDQLHAALEQARANSTHWSKKTDQFRDEALYWRDQKYAPVRARAKARREENAVLQAEIAALREENAILLTQLKERNLNLSKKQAAHDETFKERQSLHRFRLVATWLIDALLAGRASRPVFGELLHLAKEAADTIERGDLFMAFEDKPEKYKRLCHVAESLQKA
jgi:ATP-dependent Clp protease ATP-binding subunit ClpA